MFVNYAKIMFGFKVLTGGLWDRYDLETYKHVKIELQTNDEYCLKKQFDVANGRICIEG